MALIKPYKEFTPKEQEVAKMQGNLKEYIEQFSDLLFLRGRLIQSQSISTSTTPIEHKLGRQPLGWFVLDKTADARIWRVSWDDKFITLDTSAAVTINLWVF